MTLTRRIMWAGIALAALLWPLVLAAGVARANGIGDLYVGAGSRIVEVHLAGAAVVNTVDLPHGATSVAFSPDGRSLYAATGRSEVSVVDIGTISLAGAVTAAGPVVAVAHPAGDRLAVAIPDLQRVALLPSDGGTATDVALAGSPDLLAADRRAAIVLAASSSGGWVAVIDASLGTSRTVPIDGRVVGLVVDRDSGGAYIATRSPDAVVRLDLGTRKVAWTVKLSATPTGIASVVDGAVVASGKRLFKASASGATAFETLPDTAVAVAGSDDGKVVVVALGDRVLAYAASGGSVRSEVAMAAGEHATAIAPVPKPIVLDGAGGSTASPRPAASTRATQGRPAPRATHPPATATEADGLATTAPPLLGAAAIAGLILAAWWGIVLVNERRRLASRKAAAARAAAIRAQRASRRTRQDARPDGRGFPTRR